MITPTLEFDTAFLALTGYYPLQWQRRLYDKLCAGGIPPVCDLPTGLGKTSVIAIWVIALARQAQDGPVSLPRRLVYIVNRRTVVDQASDVVKQIRDRLLNPNRPELQAMAEALKSLGAITDPDKPLLAVSTLRGELADNEEWKTDPARPAIIVGTIDMIGSKLLFSGYGDGRVRRAQHAGLVGQDSFIIHDEAHLTPAFSALLGGIADAQKKEDPQEQAKDRRVRVMELSATARDTDSSTFSLDTKDEEDDIVRERLDAEKLLSLHEVDAKPQAALVEKLVDLGLRHKDARKVLVYVRSPEDAKAVRDSLQRRMGKDGGDRIALLTGTIRGYERDRLVQDSAVYKAFLGPKAPIDHTVYLVSTAAGEVGIDIDADHMVCDLTTLDSLIQRLGRVNRRGGQGRQARIDLVAQREREEIKGPAPELTEAFQEAWKILKAWSEGPNGTLNVSPRNLRALLGGLDEEVRQKAFAPLPPQLPLTDILLDAWALTSINKQMPGRPEVAAYLHGLEDTLPETYVAWREEVTELRAAQVDKDVLEEWFQACPIEARERLRDRTDRVQRTLGKLLDEHRKNGKADFPVVILNERGEAQMHQLSEIATRGFNLGFLTVVLPVEAGGLKDGALDAAETEVAENIDVAEWVSSQGQNEHTQRQRERWLEVRNSAGERRLYRLGEKRGETGVPEPHLPKELARITLDESEDEGETRDLVLYGATRHASLEDAEKAPVQQSLDFHLKQIAEHMGRISDALGLDGNIKEALIIAARWHDQGKDRPIWQQYAYNPDPSTPLAKSHRYRNGRFLGGYRHEFGSMLEAASNSDEEIRSHLEADLILHLIAAHHGRARPHFEPNAWDTAFTTTQNEGAAAEAMRRFARLQQRFGRWGLAWLEALVRCADIAASKEDEPQKDAARKAEVAS